MISVARSPTPPPSLEAKSSYSGADVQAALRSDFLGKCYLCERKLSGALQVEHLKPKTGAFQHLEFDWNNLYPSESCNQSRKTWQAAQRIDPDTAYPAGGLLDPTDPTSDPMDRLVQRIAVASLPPIDANELQFEFRARDPADAPAANTASELQAIHSSPKSNGVTLRSEIYARWTRVLHFLYVLLKSRGGDREDAANKLHVLVRRDQEFYAVMRGTLEQFDPTVVADLGL